MAAADLFDLADLDALAQQELVPASATVVRRLAAALVESETGPLPAVVPDAVSVIGLAMAARAYANPTGFSSMTVGGVSITYPTNVYLTDADRAALRPYSFAGAVTSMAVPLRIWP